MISTLIFFFSLIVICTIEYVFGSIAISISLYNNPKRFLMFFRMFRSPFSFRCAKDQVIFFLVKFHKQCDILPFFLSSVYICIYIHIYTHMI